MTYYKVISGVSTIIKDKICYVFYDRQSIHNPFYKQCYCNNNIFVLFTIRSHDYFIGKKFILLMDSLQFICGKILHKNCSSNCNNWNSDMGVLLLCKNRSFKNILM